MNGGGSFGGLSGTGILPVFRTHGQDARATQGNRPEARSAAAQRRIQQDLRKDSEVRRSQWILRSE
jgi:hypothetical protein